MCFSPMHFPLNGTVVAVPAVWCCSSPPNPWNLISYVNYASNCSVKLLPNGLYSNVANLNSSSTGFCRVSLVNYNNDDTSPQTPLCFGCLGFFFLIFLHVGNIGDFFAYSVYNFWTLCFCVTMLDHGYHCNDWSNIFFNGIKTAIWSLNINLS